MCFPAVAELMIVDFIVFFMLDWGTGSGEAMCSSQVKDALEEVLRDDS